MRRRRHKPSSVARAEADTPPRKAYRVEVAEAIEWKETDPPFMRAIYERDAPYLTTRPRARERTVGEVLAAEERRREKRRQATARRRARDRAEI